MQPTFSCQRECDQVVRRKVGESTLFDTHECEQYRHSLVITESDSLQFSLTNILKWAMILFAPRELKIEKMLRRNVDTISAQPSSTRHGVLAPAIAILCAYVLAVLRRLGCSM